MESIVGFVMPEKVEQALRANYRFRPWAKTGNSGLGCLGNTSSDEGTKNKEGGKPKEQKKNNSSETEGLNT